jgi:hypothetical protein
MQYLVTQFVRHSANNRMVDKAWGGPELPRTICLIKLHSVATSIKYEKRLVEDFSDDQDIRVMIESKSIKLLKS